MRILCAVILLLTGVSAAGGASAAATDMVVVGELRVNGHLAPDGTLVAVGESGASIIANTTVEDGAFLLRVPADDPVTSAREGAQEGALLAFHVLGGTTTPRLAFHAGTNATFDVGITLPDLRVETASAQPSAVAEGDNVTLTVIVSNRGASLASQTRLEVTHAGRVLGSAYVGELSPDATRPVSMGVRAVGFSGDVSLRVVATNARGDADPSSDARSVALRVEPNAAPNLTLRVAPVAPTASDEVRLVADATDDDGIAWVHFYWEAETVRDANVTAPPYQVGIGTFPANATVRVWAVAGDAGPAAKTAVAPPQAVRVRDATSAASPDDTATPSAPATTTPTPTQTPTGSKDAAPPPARTPSPAWIAVAAVALVVLARGRRS